LLWAAAAPYWPLLQSSPDAEVLGRRLVWAVLSMACTLAATGHVGALRALVRHRRKGAVPGRSGRRHHGELGGLHLGVNHGHVVEASLGFFINPLMTVLLGVVVLGERVRPGQWVAIGLAALAVLVVSVDYGHLPWYALMLAFSGGFYGLFKKKAEPDRTSRWAWRQRSSLLLPWSTPAPEREPGALHVRDAGASIMRSCSSEAGW
jgi:chloramphenicol-sensitive protein RarD